MTETQATNLPSTELIDLIPGAASSPALQIFLNDRLYNRCIDVATRMAQAQGVTPKHLLGNPAACFSVIQMSIIWKLAPPMVAGATYQTPNGQIGYEGKLCQAILENSGQIEGGLKSSYYGDWDKIEGNFKMEARTTQGGKKYEVPVATWDRKDEVGVGVEVSAQIKGEAEPRTLKFDLRSAQPRNSTLWPLRPKQQLWYTAVRAFGNVAAPGIFMGVPFDPVDNFGEAAMVDITPTDKQPATQRPAKPAEAKKAAKKGADKLDEGFKAAVADATPKPAETVIEDTPAETEPEQEEPENDAQETPEREEAQPSEQTETPAETKAPAAEAPKATDAPAMTEAESKKFRAAVETKVVKWAKSAEDFEAYKAEIRPEYRRLKAAFPEQAAKLSEMISAKTEAIKEREAKDSME